MDPTIANVLKVAEKVSQNELENIQWCQWEKTGGCQIGSFLVFGYDEVPNITSKNFDVWFGGNTSSKRRCILKYCGSLIFGDLISSDWASMAHGNYQMKGTRRHFNFPSAA